MRGTVAYCGPHPVNHHAQPTLRRLAAAYLAAAVPFLLLDSAWLATMSERLYRPAIGHLMRPGFDLGAALAFYALYFAGVVAFAVRHADSGRAAMLRGAGFGLVCYATYDLTNQATLAGWPWRVTVADLVWGAFATGISAWVSHRIVFARR